METIAIRNIRSLTSCGPIKFAPITLLVGQNSSGKSTFVRLLPMLKQGAEARTREPLLWLGRLVDFGSAEEALSRFSKEKTLGVTMELSVSSSILDGRRRAWVPPNEAQKYELVALSVDYRISEKSTSSATFVYTAAYRNQKITIHFANSGNVTLFQINDIDLNHLAEGLSARWLGPIPSFESLEVESLTGKGAYAELFRFVRANLDGRTGLERAQRLSRALTFGPIETLYQRALSASAGDEYWRRRIRAWGENSENLQKLARLVIAYQFFNEIASALAAQTRRTLSNVRYITPIRASAERYYRLQGLSIEEIDPQGDNVAMYLHNLSDSEKDHFGKWTKSFFGIEIVTEPSRGHVSLMLKGEENHGSSFNLADTGFGYSQMLPILVQLWSIGFRKRSTQQNLGPTIFAIEQPELHLHPKLQAKLADVFIQAINASKKIGVDLRLVIETHSEQLISALGLRIAQHTATSPANPTETLSELKVLPSDVNIVMFEKEHLNQPTSVSETSFDVDGVLASWPYGFFDAAL